MTSCFPFYDVTSLAKFPVHHGPTRSGIHTCTVHMCPRELYPRRLIFVLVNVSDVTRFHNVLVSDLDFDLAKLLLAIVENLQSNSIASL